MAYSTFDPTFTQKNPTNLRLPLPRIPDADPQQDYDDSTQIFSNSGEGVADDAEESESSLNENYEPDRFLGDYRKYSAHFHDNENGAPGIDNDFGTRNRIIDPNTIPSTANGGLIEVAPTGDQPREGFEDPNLKLRAQVLEVLGQTPYLNALDIGVEVNGAVVTLLGTVPKSSMRELASNAAESVIGVDRVVNLIGERVVTR